MKKMTFVIAAFMFMLAAPVIAGTVTMTIVDNGDHTADITYVADANISAFALDITVDAGTITAINNYFVGECDDVNKGYGIFLGTIDIDDTGAVVSWGSPIAEVADLPGDTKPGLGNNGVTVEMGALYTTGRRPSRTGTLCTLTVSSDCNMTVSGNVGRGKVVQENSTQATLIGDTEPIVMSGCTMPDVDGLSFADACDQILAAGFPAPTNAGSTADNSQAAGTVNSQDPAPGGPISCTTPVTLGLAYNYPTCWDLTRQCHADYSDDGLVDTADWGQIRDGWLKAYPNATYIANACADYYRDGMIDTADWPQIRDWWLKNPPADCVAGDPAGIFDPD